MTNAKLEFIEHTKPHSIKCATITFGDDWVENGLTYNLPTCWSTVDMDNFLNCIDKNYDSGYGRQELFGIIWYTDGTWSDRGEYDGSEWWQHHECPEITEDLIK
jgi:hypothetical protein